MVPRSSCGPAGRRSTRDPRARMPGRPGTCGSRASVRTRRGSWSRSGVRSAWVSTPWASIPGVAGGLRGPSHGQPSPGCLAPGGAPEPGRPAAGRRLGLRGRAQPRGRIGQPGARPGARPVGIPGVRGRGAHPVCDGPHPGINEALERDRLVDHHVHSIVPGSLDERTFLSLLTESDRPAAIEAAGWDSQLGMAVRRWCAPLLGLERHVPPDAYLAHRLALTQRGRGGDPAAGGRALGPRWSTPASGPGSCWTWRPSVALAGARPCDHRAPGVPGGGCRPVRRRRRRLCRTRSGRRSRRPWRRPSAASPSSPTGTGWTSIRCRRPSTRSPTAAGSWLRAIAATGGSSGSPIRCCSASASGRAPGRAGRSRSMSASGIPTWTCIARTRRC